jgi:N-acetylglucosaminyl-diphospho-decaprenol L-rhamnosyltransferase
LAVELNPGAVGDEVRAPARHVAVQFVNYKTKDYLLEAVQGVVGDTAGAAAGIAGSDWTIRVLDNASGDDLGDLAERFPDASLMVRHNATNAGFGAGHNILAGLEPEPDLILILNPDVRYLQRDTLSRLLAAMKAEGAVAAGPKLVHPDGQPQLFDHGELFGWRSWVARQIGLSVWAPALRTRVVAWVSGAAMLVDGPAFRRVGGFDEQFFLYKEEEDLCTRLRGEGRPVVYVPDVVLEHVGHVVANPDEHLIESERLFRAKYGVEAKGLYGKLLGRVNRYTNISYRPVDAPRLRSR